MSDRKTPGGSVAITLGLSVMTLGALAALVAVVRAMGPSSAQSAPPPPEQIAAAPAPANSGFVGPLTFRDPDNTKRYQALKELIPKVQQAVAELGAAKAMPDGKLEATCTEVIAAATPLAGEDHPKVRAFGDGAIRLCDYERPLATIGLIVRLLHAKPKLPEKRALCDVGGKSVQRLTDRKYGDDEKVKLQLAELGKACL
ncbi:MAG: hypothetical protein HYV09_28765 [Deltaproteobacteria bacterium]|nr:hypothetical protein [Deltaproteobacteria bacterium]